MKNVKILIVMLILMFANIYADLRVEVHLKHAPEEVINQCIAQEKGQSLAEKIEAENTPAQISQKLMKNKLRTLLKPSLSGFMGIYGGFMDISSKDGLLVFPRRQEKEIIYVAIAPSVELVKVKGNTFSHREFKLGDDSKLYVCERKVDKKKIVYWHVKEEAIPADKKINETTIVIFSKTKNIYVPQGDFLSVESGHLILPDIYVIGNFDQEKIISQALDLKQYFEPITKEKKIISETCVQKMINNI